MSLVEVLVAMFVFMIITLALVAIFSSIILMNEKSRQNSVSMEEARTAMEAMSKNIRMSSQVKINEAGNRITMFNHSQEKCILYNFTSSDVLRRREVVIPEGDRDDCSEENGGDNCNCADSTIYSSAVSMTQSVMDGKFFVGETDKSSDPKVIGKATIQIKIDDRVLQTSVSFRDYEGIVQ
ncbi:MAG: hypothetical protein QG620_595 [Patescibacteria group bacterium]|nr:hypothetical protein [Patescibacteria group bacterium]